MWFVVTVCEAGRVKRNNCKTSVAPKSFKIFKLRGTTKIIWLVIHGDRQVDINFLRKVSIVSEYLIVIGSLFQIVGAACALRQPQRKYVCQYSA